MSRCNRLQWGVQCLFDFWIGIVKWFGGLWFGFQQRTRRVQVEQIRQNTTFGRTAVARICDMFDDFAEALENGRRLIGRHCNIWN